MEPVHFVFLASTPTSSTPAPYTIPHPRTLSQPQRHTLSQSQSQSLYEEWMEAIDDHFGDDDEIPITVISGRFGQIDPLLITADCVVSPGNSFGIMDEGFDLELSQALKSDSGHPYSLTSHVQAYIQHSSSYNGYIPPGSCLILPLPTPTSSPHFGPGLLKTNPWRFHSLAILPTTRTSQSTSREDTDVGWTKDTVYNAMWNLLVEIMRWNKEVGDSVYSHSHSAGRAAGEGGLGGGEPGLASPPPPGRSTNGTAQTHAHGQGGGPPSSNVKPGKKRIERVLITGVGTGPGGIPPRRCAQQMVLAIKHFYFGRVADEMRRSRRNAAAMAAATAATQSSGFNGSGKSMGVSTGGVRPMTMAGNGVSGSGSGSGVDPKASVCGWDNPELRKQASEVRKVTL
ncbi:hypothetical protein AX16_007492 [Volvariella volvacea WC 439]|nr:hypothetical protein AX16_007492 [Volvariella volvacea WC 439]